MPVFNAANFLDEALDSIETQEHSVLEVIAIDDGSTDESVRMLERRPQVRLVKQPNSGPPTARNRGIATAKGEFLAFLDADDVWLPGKLAIQVGALEKDPGLDVLFGHIEEFCTEGVSELTRRARTRTVPGYLWSTMMVRRDAFERVGALNTELRFGELIDWIDRARREQLRIEMLSDVVARRRIHGGNFGMREPESRRDYARVIHAVLRRRRESGGDESASSPVGSRANDAAKE